MLYLFYTDTLGWIPAVNDGQLIMPNKYARSRRALLTLANNWLGKRAGQVYLMREWTQQMCELGPTAFSEYIRHHGELLTRSHYST